MPQDRFIKRLNALAAPIPRAAFIAEGQLDSRRDVEPSPASRECVAALCHEGQSADLLPDGAARANERYQRRAAA